MQMNSFVNIITVFNDTRGRTIDKLVSVYNDHKRLKTLIAKSIDGNLSQKEIKGKNILLKPNWVKHSYTPDDDICLRTNDNFLIAVLDIILEFKPYSVIIGDAPIQGCNWDKVVTEELKIRIDNLSNKYNVPVKIKDFRRRIYDPSKNELLAELHPLSDYVIFDLAKDSYLEEITVPGKNIFRVTNYDPDRMADAHSPGVHKYCIAKDFFEADVVISLPKVKTHQKAGITGAVKNIVGINGDKDFLPHHRIGGTKMGGDCYPGGSRLRYLSELLLDKANRKQGRKSYLFWQKLSSLLWRLSGPGPEYSLAAGWYGNDTTWRMVMDLNIIAINGNIDGTLSGNPHRKFYSLCDGIIGGQGNGPLEPEPLPLGIISFTDNSFVNDRAMAMLMGFSYFKVPLLNKIREYDTKCNIMFNGKNVSLKDLSDYLIETIPPQGWVSYFKRVK